MNLNALSKREKAGYVLLIIGNIIVAEYLTFTYFVNGDYVGVVLFGVWLILEWGFIGLFISRAFKDVTPVSEDERASIQQIAREHGAAFRSIWNLTDDPPPYQVGVGGVLPGRHELFLDLDWFEQLPPSQQKATIALAGERTVRHRPAKYIGLYLAIFTLYLVHHFMTVFTPDPSTLWFDVGPELLAAIGILLVTAYNYREVFEIDQAVADETSAQTLKELIEDDSEVASNIAIKLRAILAIPTTKKRLERLSG